MNNEMCYPTDEDNLKVQTGTRINQEILKGIKMLAEEKEISISDLLEMIIIKNVEGECAFTKGEIELLKRYVGAIMNKNTIVVSAKPQTYNTMYMNNNPYWWSCVNIDSWRIPYLEYLAIYQIGPISTITHYSRIDTIKIHPGTRKYDIFLKGSRMPVSIKEAPQLVSVRGRRYTELNKIVVATDMRQVF